jgi:invasion protein IalB
VQATDGRKSCAMSQTLTNAQTRRVVSVFSVGKDQTGKLFANIQTPVGFVVSEGVKLAIDTKTIVPIPFRTCVANGCLAVLELNATVLEQLQKASKLTVSLQSLQNTPATLEFSSKGFAKAYDKLVQESG